MQWSAEVQRFATTAVEESRVIEFKREPELGGRDARIEMLKDLTGMANGGGGIVAFGIDEARHADGRVTSAGVRPIEDRAISGQISDIIRDSVFPPLLVEFHEVDVEGGYVLVAELFPSALGPHMVEAYGQNRYFTRLGRSTAPMSEQQVRDRYALALRASDQRDKTWEQHGLPMLTNSGPWLSIAVLPHQPLTKRFAVGRVGPADLALPPHILTVVQEAGIAHVHTKLGRWADGLAGFDGTRRDLATAAIRIHEDGAAACGRQLAGSIDADDIARAVNGMLVYLAWASALASVRNVLEVEVRLDRVSQVELELRETGTGPARSAAAHQPVGLSVTELAVRREVRPEGLTSAHLRHRLVRDFIDKITLAFGEADKTVPFDKGPLYGAGGHPAGATLAGDRIYAANRRYQDLVLYADGSFRVMHNSAIAGYVRDGVIIDRNGDTVAVTELACGGGCPDDYVKAADGEDAWQHVPPGPLGIPSDTTPHVPGPEPTRRWSSASLDETIEVARAEPSWS